MLQSMTAKGIVTVFVLTTLLFFGCSSSQIIGSWAKTGLTPGAVDHVMVIGVAQNDMIRRAFEDQMVARLNENGIKASASYQFISQDEKADKDIILQHLQKNNIDGVQITQIIDQRTETVVMPATTTVRTDDINRSRRSGSPRHNSWYRNYSTSFDVTHTPSRVVDFDILVVETTLYRIDEDQEEPIWSAHAETAPGGNLDSDLSSLIGVFIRDMSSQGVF